MSNPHMRTPPAHIAQIVLPALSCAWKHQFGEQGYARHKKALDKVEASLKTAVVDRGGRLE